MGSCSKPKHAPSVDDHAPKGLQCQGQVVEKVSLSDDFWGTSTGDIDNPIGLSQRSISSISTSNVSFHSDLGSASMNSHNDFVNHGKFIDSTFHYWIFFMFLFEDVRDRSLCGHFVTSRGHCFSVSHLYMYNTDM